MLGFLIGLGCVAVGGGCVYGLIVVTELLCNLVTPGSSSAAGMAMVILCLMAMSVAKWVGEGIIEARSRR